MTDQMLRSEGYLKGGGVGTINQIVSPHDYSEELDELLTDGDGVVVGESTDEGAGDVAALFDGVTEVTRRRIAQVVAISQTGGDVNDDVVEWLQSHEGDEVFAVHW